MTIQALYEIYTAWVIFACFTLTAFALVVAAFAFCERNTPMRRLAVFLAMGCIMGAKSAYPTSGDKEGYHVGSSFQMDAFLSDAGCYSTNDTVHIAISSNLMTTSLDGCDVMVYARYYTNSTAEAWFELSPRYKFETFPHDYQLESATNYNYAVYVDYVPGPSVHTNGVFNLFGDLMDENLMERRTFFPNTIRKDHDQ